MVFGNGLLVIVDVVGIYYVIIIGVNNCVVVDFVVVEILFLLVFEILGGLSLCVGSSLELFVSVIYVIYSWEGVVNVLIFDVFMLGIYGLMVIDVNGCIGIINMEIIEVLLLEVNLFDSVVFCMNGSVDLEVVFGFI